MGGLRRSLGLAVLRWASCEIAQAVALCIATGRWAALALLMGVAALVVRLRVPLQASVHWVRLSSRRAT